MSKVRTGLCRFPSVARKRTAEWVPFLLFKTPCANMRKSATARPKLVWKSAENN